MTQVLPFAIEIVLFGIVVALVFALERELSRFLNQRRRLDAGHGGAAAMPLLADRMVDNRFLQWVRRSTSIRDAEEHKNLSHTLVLAGIEHPAGPVWFVVLRVALAIVLPVIFLLAVHDPATPAGTGLVLWALILCGVGLMLPGIYIRRRTAGRQAELDREFPDALDLTVVCIEAGLGLDGAFVRVGEVMDRSHPAIAGQLGRLADELSAGKSRADALRAMATRTGTAAIRSFVALVIQSEMLGASIAQTLRTFAAEMRQTRYLTAEKRAMRIPVLMTLPLVACILPVIVTALLLPVIIDVVRHLMPALSGVRGG